jgi:hypothetical protein
MRKNGKNGRKTNAKAPLQVEALKHMEDKRRNIPTAEHQSVIDKAEEAPKQVRNPRNTDLDPQLVWCGKDYQDWTDLVVQAPLLYIQENIHPKALIDDLMRQSNAGVAQQSGSQIDLFRYAHRILDGLATSPGGTIEGTLAGIAGQLGIPKKFLMRALGPTIGVVRVEPDKDKRLRLILQTEKLSKKKASGLGRRMSIPAWMRAEVLDSDGNTCAACAKKRSHSIWRSTISSH